jgi:hypothetical protein
MPEASKYQRLNKGSFSKIDYVKVDGTLVAREWLYCREYFQDESAGIRRFLFCHKSNKCKNIAAFVDKIENVLGVPDRSIIGPTQRYNISWISVSFWWTNTSMKRSLFTALLRCGQNYDAKKENFEDALFSVLYTKHTEYAVRRFLDGNTRYTGKKRGWYNQFRWGGGTSEEPRMPSRELVEKLLVRPI